MLGGDFIDRVRALRVTTQTHIPVALRARHARIWAATLEGAAAGLPGWTALEGARSRLLLLDPPGTHVPTELAAHADLWERGSYEELLCRAEA